MPGTRNLETRSKNKKLKPKFCIDKKGNDIVQREREKNIRDKLTIQSKRAKQFKEIIKAQAKDGLTIPANLNQLLSDAIEQDPAWLIEQTLKRAQSNESILKMIWERVGGKVQGEMDTTIIIELLDYRNVQVPEVPKELANGPIGKEPSGPELQGGVPPKTPTSHLDNLRDSKTALDLGHCNTPSQAPRLTSMQKGDKAVTNSDEGDSGDQSDEGDQSDLWGFRTLLRSIPGVPRSES